MLQIRNILLARDFSPFSDHALCYAVDLARRTGSTLHLFYADVLHTDPFVPEVPNRSRPSDDHIRERLLQDVDDTLLPDKYPKIEMRAGVERDVAAAPVILDYADDQDIDLIVLGTRGRRGAARMLLGSVAEEVVRRAKQPVLTVHKPDEEVRAVTPPPPIERILVPVDFWQHSREALRHAHAIAQLYEARLDLLHVTEEHLQPTFYGEGVDATYDLIPERKAEERLRTFYRESARTELGDWAVHVRSGRAADQIIQFAEKQGSDLVVMSASRRTGVHRFLLGSVAEKIVRYTPAPVFTVKAFGKSLVPPLTEEDPGAAN
jgi:nucleotide-binding universal stress UspA family protein